MLEYGRIKEKRGRKKLETYENVGTIEMQEWLNVARFLVVLLE